jgi:ubiquinone/menaquinone biosynthesis C-methylase UbiE
LFNYSTVIDALPKEARTSVVVLSGIKAGDRVPDIGCGSGGQASFCFE